MRSYWLKNRETILKGYGLYILNKVSSADDKSCKVRSK